MHCIFWVSNDRAVVKSLLLYVVMVIRQHKHGAIWAGINNAPQQKGTHTLFDGSRLVSPAARVFPFTFSPRWAYYAIITCVSSACSASGKSRVLIMKNNIIATVQHSQLLQRRRTSGAMRESPRTLLTITASIHIHIHTTGTTSSSAARRAFAQTRRWCICDRFVCFLFRRKRRHMQPTHTYLFVCFF